MWFIAGALCASAVWFIILSTGQLDLLNQLLGAR